MGNTNSLTKEYKVNPDEMIYGLATTTSRLNRQTFEVFLSSITGFKVEIKSMSSNLGESCFAGRNDKIVELSQNEVIPHIEKALDETICLPYKGPGFFNTPFFIEYRCQKEKKFAHLMVTGLKRGNVIISYNIFVREQ